MKQKFECSRGGLIIRGYEYRKKAGTLPAVILSHGYLANQRMCRKYAELAADMGYAAFTFDFNGGGLFSRSTGKSTDMTILTEMEDLKAVLDFVKQRDDVDSDNIILLGCSQGGLVSALVAKELYGCIKKLILLYPALCIPDDARKGRMMFARFDPDDIPDVIQRFPVKLSGNYARCVKEWNVFEKIKGFENPVLLIHGTADKLVDISYARKAAEIFSNVEYHEVTGGGHMFRGKYDTEAIRLIRWFLN